MPPSAKRVAMRHVRAAIPKWDGRPVSWAWISQAGTVDVLKDADEGPGFDGEESGHDRWARVFLGSRAVPPGKTPSQVLLEAGWVRMVTPFDFETDRQAFRSDRALYTTLQILVNTTRLERMDPERHSVVHAFGASHKTSTIADFVRREGGREWEDKLFRGLSR